MGQGPRLAAAQAAGKAEIPVPRGKKEKGPGYAPPRPLHWIPISCPHLPKRNPKDEPYTDTLAVSYARRVPVIGRVVLPVLQPCVFGKVLFFPMFSRILSFVAVAGKSQQIDNLEAH